MDRKEFSIYRNFFIVSSFACDLINKILGLDETVHNTERNRKPLAEFKYSRRKFENKCYPRRKKDKNWTKNHNSFGNNVQLLEEAGNFNSQAEKTVTHSFLLLRYFHNYQEILWCVLVWLLQFVDVCTVRACIVRLFVAGKVGLIVAFCFVEIRLQQLCSYFPLPFKCRWNEKRRRRQCWGYLWCYFMPR